MPDNDYPGSVGFGRIPSQQNKIEEKTETPILLRQYKWSVLISFGFLISLYVAANAMLGKGDMYYIVIGLYLMLSIVAFVYSRRFFEKRYENYYLFSEQSDEGEYRNHLAVNTIRAFVIGLSLFVGLSTQTTTYAVSVLYFPDQPPLTLSVIITSLFRFASIALAVSMTWPTVTILYRLIASEIKDAYHNDTQTKQNSDKLALDRERLHWEQEKYFLEHDIVDSSPEETDAIVHPVMLSAPHNPNKPMTEYQGRFAQAVYDFLDGLDNGRWGTDERSWRNENGQAKRLERSGFRLLSIGHEIRDQFISKKWARWKSEDHKSGWELLFDTDEIRSGAFGNNGVLPSAPTKEDGNE